ncbi:hypothetical protein HYPSUDRAFT_200742 [Hypholoma sublateritium FD-334 SS-4]|uniref:Uncharacterized protein n=1 Tax=Hypholoma sublateritium (strain FD-334 SS-4) TaxID=945553 RepID=A0A0D2LAK5_HYPSF|nr:hypothetical protein HYPSUDRAFT_200742 [Hypholoma sublateritium FD-334 SS-4]
MQPRPLPPAPVSRRGGTGVHAHPIRAPTLLRQPTTQQAGQLARSLHAARTLPAPPRCLRGAMPSAGCDTLCGVRCLPQTMCRGDQAGVHRVQRRVAATRRPTRPCTLRALPTYHAGPAARTRTRMYDRTPEVLLLFYVFYFFIARAKRTKGHGGRKRARLASRAAGRGAPRGRVGVIERRGSGATAQDYCARDGGAWCTAESSGRTASALDALHDHYDTLQQIMRVMMSNYSSRSHRCSSPPRFAAVRLRMYILLHRAACPVEREPIMPRALPCGSESGRAHQKPAARPRMGTRGTARVPGASLLPGDITTRGVALLFPSTEPQNHRALAHTRTHAHRALWERRRPRRQTPARAIARASSTLRSSENPESGGPGWSATVRPAQSSTQLRPSMRSQTRAQRPAPAGGDTHPPRRASRRIQRRPRAQRTGAGEQPRAARARRAPGCAAYAHRRRGASPIAVGGRVAKRAWVRATLDFDVLALVSGAIAARLDEWMLELLEVGSGDGSSASPPVMAPRDRRQDAGRLVWRSARKLGAVPVTACTAVLY